MNKNYQRVPQEFIEKFGNFDSPISDIVVNVPELTITIRYITPEENPCKYITSFILTNLFEHISNFSTFDYKFSQNVDQVDFYERVQPHKGLVYKFLKKSNPKFMFMIFYKSREMILRCPRVSASNYIDNFLKDVNNLLLNHPYKLA